MLWAIRRKAHLKIYAFYSCSCEQSRKKSVSIARWLWLQLEISVDPTRSLGKRSCLVSDARPQQPTLLEHNVPIPRCALTPPCANSAQMLVWYPRGNVPICIIPPAWKSDTHQHHQLQKRNSKLWAWLAESRSPLNYQRTFIADSTPYLNGIEYVCLLNGKDTFLNPITFSIKWLHIDQWELKWWVWWMLNYLLAKRTTFHYSQIELYMFTVI